MTGAQTLDPTPSVETPRLAIEEGVLTVDDGTGRSVPTLLGGDGMPVSPVVYERVLYSREFPVIVGRIDDGTDNFFFGGLSYRPEPRGEMAAGWYVTFPEMFPASRLLDVQVTEGGSLGFMAVIGEEYPALNPHGYDYPAEYLGKPAVYLRFEGPYPLTPPLDTLTTPDGETVYPTLETFGFTYPVVVGGVPRYDLPYDDFATVATVHGERITYGDRGQGILAWETAGDAVFTWVEPEDVPFMPAVQINGVVQPLAMNGGVAWRLYKAPQAEEVRSVRVFTVHIPKSGEDLEETALYWVEFAPLRVVRLTYWYIGLLGASLAFLPDGSGILMSAFGPFGDETEGWGVWRLAPGAEPELLVRDQAEGFIDMGLAVAPRLTDVSDSGFTLTASDPAKTRYRFDLNGTPLTD